MDALFVVRWGRVALTAISMGPGTRHRALRLLHKDVVRNVRATTHSTGTPRLTHSVGYRQTEHWAPTNSWIFPTSHLNLCFFQ